MRDICDGALGAKKCGRAQEARAVQSTATAHSTCIKQNMKRSTLFSTVAIGIASSSSSEAFHLAGRSLVSKNIAHSDRSVASSSWFAAAPIAIAVVLTSALPSVATEGDITKGQEIFTSTCAGCHRGGQNFVKEKKTLQKDALAKFVGLDQDKVETFFRGSLVHRVGPVGQLQDDEVVDVITYVVDQAVNEKW